MSHSPSLEDLYKHHVAILVQGFVPSWAAMEFGHSFLPFSMRCALHTVDRRKRLSPFGFRCLPSVHSTRASVEGRKPHGKRTQTNAIDL